MQKRQFLSCILTLSAAQCFSQDPQFLNPTQSLNHLNPSFAGSSGGIRNQFNIGQSEMASTLYNSFDVFLAEVNGGLSAGYLYDETNEGALQTNYFSLAYAQYFTVDGDWRIIPSLQLSYIKRSALYTHYFGEIADRRYGKFYTGDTRHTLNAAKTSVDGSAGLLMQNKNFYAGLAFMHLNQPDIGLAGVLPLPMRVNLHASYIIHLDESTLVHFSGQHFRQKNEQGSQIQLQSVLLGHLAAGAGFTTGFGNTAFFTLGYRANFWSVILTYNPNFRGQPNYWEAAFSLHSRNKEQRRQLNAFEAW